MTKLWFKTKKPKDKWYRFGDSFVNLSYAIRVFKKNPKNVTIEYHEGFAPYDFLTEEEADICLNKIWDWINE